MTFATKTFFEDETNKRVLVSSVQCNTFLPSTVWNSTTSMTQCPKFRSVSQETSFAILCGSGDAGVARASAVPASYPVGDGTAAWHPYDPQLTRPACLPACVCVCVCAFRFVQLVAQLNDTNAQMTIDGKAVKSGERSGSVGLQAGASTQVDVVAAWALATRDRRRQ